MTPLIAAMALGCAPIASHFGFLQEPGRDMVVGLANPEGGVERTEYTVMGDRMDPAKIDPKHGWTFEWCVPCKVRPNPAVSLNLAPRFRVFEQQRKAKGDLAEQVGRMCLRMWDLAYQRLKRDHNPRTNFGIVDYYLCFGGKAGGEQCMDIDPQEKDEGGGPKKVNTVYIYAVQTFTEPVEMAREVAHEYGHATLPPVGGFKEPEDWANGYLGERLFLKWIRDMMLTGKYGPYDAMGAGLADLDKWVKRKVDPLVEAAGQAGPNNPLLRKQGQPAMDAYIGLAMYAEATLPANVFGRSLLLTGSTSSEDYPKAIALAAEEPDSYIFSVPKALVGKPIWAPLGKATVTGNATVLKRDGGWAQVKAMGTAFRVVNRKSGSR